MGANDERKQKERRDLQEEGHQARQKANEHRARISHIKEKKIDLLA